VTASEKLAVRPPTRAELAAAPLLRHFPRVLGRADKRLAERAAKRYSERYIARYGFPPPPDWSDMSGYETLLDAILERDILDVPGDFVEIGAFLGGGSYKLGRLLARRPEKRLIVVDVFDPSFDETECDRGLTMAEIYAEWSRERVGNDVANQRRIFDSVTAGLANVEVVVGDSASVELPADRVAFGFIDGNHSAAYVRSDFEMIWDRISPGGIVAFHDYGHDINEVTETIHQLVGERADELSRIWVEGEFFFAHRR
jgi:hypothetical protein